MRHGVRPERGAGDDGTVTLPATTAGVPSTARAAGALGARVVARLAAPAEADLEAARAEQRRREHVRRQVEALAARWAGPR
jgi:hypothetical protein